MAKTSSFKSKILDFAISGKLTKQLLSDGNSEDLYFKLQKEKAELIKNKIIRKEKQLPVVLNEEMTFDIPNNWKWVRLNDLCLSITDGTHKTPNYVEKGIPFLSVKNISSGVFELDDIKYISKNEHSKLIQRCKPEKNDILICRIGTLGKAIKINIDLEFSIFVSLGLLKLLNINMADYIVSVLNSKYAYNWIEKNKAGGAMHTFKINLESLKMIPIPLPPIAEQKRINEQISKINLIFNDIEKNQESYNKNYSVLCKKIIELGISGKLTKQLDSDGSAEDLYNDIIKEKERLIKIGKLKKEKRLPEVSDDEIPFDIPKNWKFIRIGNLYEICTGTSIAKDVKDKKYRNVKDGYPYIGTKDVSINHEIIYNNGVKIPKTETGFRYAEANSTLLCIEGGSAGKKIAITNTKVCYGNKLCKFYSNRLEARFVYYYLQSDLFRQLFFYDISGLIDGVNIGKIKSIPFPLPPLAEQKRIVEKIEALLEE